MARVTFARAIQRHVEVPELIVDAPTVRDVLELVFAKHPRVRGYVLDEQGALRRHVAVFVDGQAVVDRARLADAVDARSEIHVMQALTGGAPSEIGT